MYLKRLELKGFKSFADKCSIVLEPGISAIVGPNGSGKSNICDAILWVLGERNAKSLRGSVMDDVIFAGSSSRNAVSVAEVNLILDNTDKTLPIEFNEVSVSRRLYRSGESEYLINGVTSRRLDVLDILHDSGLGTDTNSIISQGHLDSILQSQPSDRRALIEEAAGVLKHKQRKDRSERKLARMDENLTRIADVLAEIERQLKPLRIKAKRAAAYDGLCERLSDLTLQLAVDDLKKINTLWKSATQKKDEYSNSVEEKKNAFNTAENNLTQLRNKISSQNEKILEYSDKQRKLNSYIEKFDSFVMLLTEKIKHAHDMVAKYSSANLSPEKKSIVEEIENLETKLKSLIDESNSINNELKAAKENSEEFNNKYNQFLSKYNELRGKLLNHQNEVAELRKKLNDAQDDIVEAQAKTAHIKTKIKDYQEQLNATNKEIEKLDKEKNDKSRSLDKLKTAANKIEQEIEKCNKNRNNESDIVDDLRSKLIDVEASIAALDQILKASFDESSSATKWLEANKSYVASDVRNLSDEIDVPDKYLSLVETLLGSYSTSFVTKNQKEVIKIDDALKEAQDAEGSVRLIFNDSTNYPNVSKAVSEENAISLFDEVSVSGKNKALSTLANVVVFETSFEAFKSAQKYKDLICASLDGTIIYPDGRCQVGSPFYVDSAFDSDSRRSVLSHKKNLKKLNKSADKIKKQLNKSLDKLTNYNDDLSSLQEKEYESRHNIAIQSADLDIVVNKFNDKTNTLNQLKTNLEEAIHEEKLLNEAYSSTVPEMENNKNKLRELDDLVVKETEELNTLKTKLDECRADSDKKRDTVSDIELRLATLAERINFARSNLETSKNRLATINEKEISDKHDLMTNNKIIDDASNLKLIFEKLSKCAKNDLESLDKNSSDISEAANEFHKLSDEALDKVNKARKEYEEETEKLNSTNIELAKLEVQVQNAVDAIDAIPNITVDEALEMEDIEDREGKEERAFKLRRRIANMGTINPDAKQEYDELKERYDFLNQQVSDLKSARTSLSKINNIIEERMKDDFANTFEEVNNNFQEIFSTLFPGGKAQLELVTKEDDNTPGVEVKAQPRGKHISKMSLLSGGEKSLTALCLLFAVYKTRSTPFYILDEVEAALDDTNLRRLIKYLEALRQTTQLIMITHQRRTMEMADILYGVSMKNDGVTKVISQKLER